MSEEIREGIVENWRTTSGGFGEHYTTIDGVEYITWWDIRDPKLKGIANIKAKPRVRFTVRPGPHKLCDSPAVSTSRDTLAATVLEVIGFDNPPPMFMITYNDPVDGKEEIGPLLAEEAVKQHPWLQGLKLDNEEFASVTLITTSPSEIKVERVGAWD